MEISHVVDLCGLVDAPFFSNRCRLSVVPGHEARQILDDSLILILNATGPRKPFTTAD